MPRKDSRYIKNIKLQARALQKQHGIPHSHALNLISERNGFESWRLYSEHIRSIEQGKGDLPVPQLTLNFTNDADVELLEEDYASIEADNARELSTSSKQKVMENIRSLTKLGIEFSVFEPTITGLKKSILDATQPVRSHMLIEGYHNFSEQGQGPEHKVIGTAHFINGSSSKKTRISLYRPKTKKGDPRMWFSNLGSYAKPGDQVAIIILNLEAYLINLSVVDLKKSLEQSSSYIYQLLHTYRQEDEKVLHELLEKLKEFAKRPFKSLRSGDTGIGFTIEKMLGIEANSSKSPDYKGIELKSGRGSKTRTTLFAQVPDWSESNCKKSSEILDRFGYARGADFKLNCTISTQKENSQGLSFVYDQSNDMLIETYNGIEDVAVWHGEKLRSRLLEKHSETLWIQAERFFKDGEEHFQLKSVTHTKSPIISQLMPLIKAGIITMDHLIKRDGQTGKVSERGPLFKIDKKNLELLFPDPVQYDLL